MSKRIVPGTLFFFLVVSTIAQESWLEPQKFRCAPGEEIKIDFVTGENFIGESWDAKNKAEAVQWFFLSGMNDLSSEVKPAGGSALTLKNLPEGTHLVTMRSNSTTREWEAGKFRDYLKENGLEEIAALRASTDQRAVESVAYFTKLLLQSGNKTDDTHSKQTGLRVEIIPRKNPYSLKTGDHLQCLVLFDGKPSPHTLAKVWSRLNRTTFLQNIYTEDDGTIVFPISTKGPWMVSTLRMMPGEKAGE